MELSFGRGERPSLNVVPSSPGVYSFSDEQGRVLYVGKARSLRSRVGNYFGSPSSLTSRIRTMMGQSRKVEWTVVGGEVQALMLEFSLIQRHKPKFNIRYSDDKSYPYLAVTTGETWPKAYVTRAKKRKRGVRYWGPYPHVHAIRETTDSLTRIFPMRTCSESLFRECNRLNRPCLYFHIGRCPGPCVGAVTKEIYRKNVDEFCSFLDGRAQDTLTQLDREMNTASNELNFEAAAKRRDQLQAARRALERQEVVASTSVNDDFIGMATNEIDSSVFVFFVRQGRITGRRGMIASGGAEQPEQERLSLALRSLYAAEHEIPAQIVVAQKDDYTSIQTWLSEVKGEKVSVTQARTKERLSIIRIAEQNAQAALVATTSKRRTDLVARSKALVDLQDALNLPEAPLRIECFDISTLHGTDTVASMVVFEDGVPKPSAYRRFAIKEGTDDFSSMREVVQRRFAPSKSKDNRFAYEPGLVVIDGGKGQLSTAVAAMAQQRVTHIPVVALAKKLEEIFIPFQSEPIVLSRTSDALYLLQHIRDEAHRFAIQYHRQKRSKRLVASALDSIPGVGTKRKAKLISWFGSVELLSRATLDEIKAVPGITLQTAERIKDALSA